MCAEILLILFGILFPIREMRWHEWQGLAGRGSLIGEEVEAYYVFVLLKDPKPFCAYGHEHQIV